MNERPAPVSHSLWKTLKKVLVLLFTSFSEPIRLIAAAVVRCLRALTDYGCFRMSPARKENEMDA